MTTFVQPFLDWLLQTTLIGSVVICLILAAQKMLGGRLGPRWCHALWLVLLLRMVLPWAPSSRLSLFNLVPSWDRQVQSQQLPEIVEQQAVSAPTENAENPGAISDQEPQSEAAILEEAAPETLAVGNVPSASQWRLASIRPLLPILWLAGAIVIGAYILVSDFALWRIVKRDRALVNQEMLELFEECKEQMDVQSLVVVVPSDEVRRPGLFGFVRPRLLLPREMLDTATREEMRYVFLHELAHLKRHDIYLGWLTSLLQILHWFNPLVWFAFYRMRTDRELACDALVLTRTGQEKSHEYGGAIVGLLRRFSRSRRLPAMAGVIESKSQLKRRIAMITQFKSNSYRWSPLAAVLIIILACVSLPGAQHGRALGRTNIETTPGVTLRRVMECETYAYDPSISPDGKYYCDRTWEGKRMVLYVRELPTGQRRVLIPSGVSNCQPAISPDSTMVAYRWYDSEKDTSDLQLIGLDGTGRRNLVPSKRIFPIGWSVDGKRILGLQPKKQDEMVRWDFVWVFLEDGSVDSITTIPKERGIDSARMDLSPNDKYIAYDGRDPQVVPPKHDIFLYDIDKSREMALKHPGNNRLVGWTPDGKYIMFTSNRAGTLDLWLQRIVECKPEGLPNLIRRNIGSFYPIGITRDGTCYYTTSHSWATLYNAVLDLDTGKVLSSPVPVYQGTDTYMCVTWSPDGEYLTYCLWGDDGSSNIHIHSLATGAERVVKTNLPRSRWISWTPDGKSLIASWFSPGGGGSTVTELIRSAYKVDAQTGEENVLLRSDARGPIRIEFSPDGKSLVYNADNSLLVRDTDTDKERKIFEFGNAGWCFWWDLSPDGQRVAVGASADDSWPSHLKVISREGNELVELLPKNWGEIHDVIWAPDGKSVLITSQESLWQIPTEGGEPRKLLSSPGLGVRSRCSISMHPDGRRIAFVAREYTEEMWVMEDFLPQDMGK